TYRRLERQCLEESIESSNRGIIAVGGSLVSEPSSYERLLSSCVTIWLRASPEDHMNRVIAQGDSRPMAGNSRAMDDLKRILSERENLYKRADYIVETSCTSIVNTVNEIVGLAAVAEIVIAKGSCGHE
ncbi:MAG: shikimate kinase, partial [Gammaproteobacteria bacterium]